MSNKILFIIESPGKVKKLNQLLGPNYIVKPSVGHIQDLDKATLSIDVENGFKPNYIINKDKKTVVKELKALSKECKEVYIASDGDREGEMIAQSIKDVLNLKDYKRIIFHEITKNAIEKAIANPTVIDKNQVYAQQARRILDRLVGYKISPVLWRFIISEKSSSAGRVQSVVVRIIVDKENEIAKSISEPYFKTTGSFSFNDTKLNSVLCKVKDTYLFEDLDRANEFLNKINKNTVFIITNVINKLVQRKPSPPFITSSLQQEASTKLHLPVKRTMELAQRLYEAGLITYIRTDSTTLSKEAISEIEKYVIKTWSKEYSEPKNYTSNLASAQEAHEAIRPTHIDDIEPEIPDDQMKLYKLIWRRTVASQMSPAIINIQSIYIDGQNKKKSILVGLGPIPEKTLFVSTLEQVQFPGYLIVYDNNDSEEKVEGKLDIKEKDIVIFNQINVTEEYTKLPLRYNEANLIKYLEKQGIGRPSTFASIISKVLERKYVEIKDVAGITKESRQLIIDTTFKVKEKTNKIVIGKENKKIVPTTLGLTVNEFLMKNFEPIMDIKFTSKFESYLDQIAIGKAKYQAVLSNFYEMFNPMVELLIQKAKENKATLGSSNDISIGIKNDIEYFTGSGKYGPYVKCMLDKNWKYASIKEIDEELTLNIAASLLIYPKELGKISSGLITLNKGQYGFYLKYGGNNYSIQDENIDFESAKQIVETGDPYAIKSFKLKDKVINVKNGDYGYYIQIVGKTKQNISIPKKYNIENITIKDILAIMEDHKNKPIYKYKKN